MNDFLSFRKMITPIFIQIIFYIFVGLCVLGGLFTMVAGGGASGFFTGLLVIVIGPFLIRMYCELMIVIFRIHDELVAIRNGTAGGAAQGFPVMPPAAPVHAYAPPPPPPAH